MFIGNRIEQQSIRALSGFFKAVLALFCRAFLAGVLVLTSATHVQAMTAFELDGDLLHAGYPIRLDGEWGFYFGRQLSLPEIRKLIADDALDTVNVPQAWNDYLSVQSDGAYQHGVATYVLPIEIKRMPAQALSLKVLKITDGFRLYWASEEVNHLIPFAQSGDWQNGEAFSIDGLSFHLPIKSDGLLIVHVAKQQSYKGGIRRSIMVQRSDVMQGNMMRDLIWRSVLLGGFLIMGMHYIVQHFYVRNLLTPLMLSLVCFSAFLRVLTGGGYAYIMLEGFPDTFTEIAEKVEYLGIVFPPVMYLLFFNEMAERLIPKKIIMTVLASLVVVIVVTWVVPPELMTKNMTYYQLYLLVIACVTMYFMILAVVKNIPNTRAILASTSVVVATTLNDVYVSHSSEYNLYLLEFGFFVFLYLQANIVGRQLREGLAEAIRLSEEKKILQQSHNQAVFDSFQDHMTGLSNRKSLDAEINKSFGVEGESISLGIILFDLDHFKAINDNYGHDVGDEVLIYIASLLHGHSLRASDFKCRYGGEEFLIVLPSANLETTREVAESIRVKIQNSVAYSDGQINLKVTASFGVAIYRSYTDASIKDAITRADQALYAAKGQGRNCVVVADQ